VSNANDIARGFWEIVVSGRAILASFAKFLRLMASKVDIARQVYILRGQYRMYLPQGGN
jgi:hypothetical protein